MIQTVQYESCTRLSCAGCLPSDVVLCLDEEIVESGHTFIEATLTQACKTYGSCNSTKWKYVFEYDTDLLVDSRVLVPSDIEGVFCKGCLTNWVESLVASVAQDAFTTITAPYGDDIVADSSHDTLNLLAGDGIYIENDAETDTITISATGGGSSGECCSERIFLEVSDTGVSGIIDSLDPQDINLMDGVIPANTLVANNDSLYCTMYGTFESEGLINAAFAFYLNSTLVCVLSGGFIYQSGWEINGDMVKTADGQCTAVFHINVAGEESFVTNIDISSVDWTVDQTFQVVLDVGTETNDGVVYQNALFIDKIKAPNA